MRRECAWRASTGGRRPRRRTPGRHSGVERLKDVRRLAGLKGALDELGGGGLGAIAQGIPALRRAGGRGIRLGRGDGGAPLKVVAGEIVPIPLVLIEALVRDAVLAATAVPVVPDSDNLAEPPQASASRPPRDFQRTSIRVPIGTSTVGSGALEGEAVGGATRGRQLARRGRCPWSCPCRRWQQTREGCHGPGRAR